jgi:hypothetical protein
MMVVQTRRQALAATRLVAAMIAACAMAGSAFAQTLGEPPPDGAVEVIKVQGNVWMIAGAGGNIAVQAGDQGVIVVDTGASGMSEKVMAAIRAQHAADPLRHQHVDGAAACRRNATPRARRLDDGRDAWGRQTSSLTITCTHA